jgi:uncharacterized protein (TIRG00374 family)
MTRKNSLRLLAGAGCAVFFAWLILRQIDAGQIREAFRGADRTWIGAALAAFCTGYAARIQRWRLMLRIDNPVLRWRDCAGPLLGSFAANNVLPLRAGDVLRAFAFNARLGAGSGTVVATLFVERLLDLLMVLVLLGTTLALFGMETSRFAGVGSLVLVALACAILAVLLLPRAFAPLALGAGRAVARIAPGPGGKLLAGIGKSLATLQHLSRGSTMLQLVAWSVLAWSAEGCVFWCAALALPSVAAPLAGWLALPVGTLATLIPSTPGYVGTFDYFTVKAMTEMGNTAAGATAYALLVHMLLWLPPTLAGGLYLLLHPAGKRVQPEAIQE